MKNPASDAQRSTNEGTTWATVPSTRIVRSEERRVGKECRSLCDWSSDVCSSDLIGPVEITTDEKSRIGCPEIDKRGDDMGHRSIHADRQIGRASCRERV